MTSELHKKIFYDGIVEDRNDPEKLGRIKVRFFGLHTPNKDLIPTEDLPWASVLYPSSTNYIDPPKEGSWVVGYFSDAQKQYPIIVGLIPGVEVDDKDSRFGFSDPASNLNDRPKEVTERTLNVDGTGSTFTDSSPKKYSRKDYTEINDYSRNDEISIINFKKENVLIAVPTAAIELGSEGEETWDEPETLYNSEYPYNNAVLYESGHLVEFDNTPGAERIHEFHRTGTSREIFPDGTKVLKNVNDVYDLTYKDKKVVTYGNYNSYIQGEVNELNANTVIIHNLLDITSTTEGSVLTNIGANNVKKITENFGVQAKQNTLAGEVHLGANAVNDDGSADAPKEEPVVLGDKLVAFLEGLIKWIDGHTHATPTGPSGPAKAPPLPNSGTGGSGPLAADPGVPNVNDLKKLLSELVKTQ